MPILVALACIAVVCWTVEWTLRRPSPRRLRVSPPREPGWTPSAWDPERDAAQARKDGLEPWAEPSPEEEEPEPPLPARHYGQAHSDLYANCPACSAINAAAGELARRYGEGDGKPAHPRNSVAKVRIRDGALWCSAHGMFTGPLDRVAALAYYFDTREAA